VRFAIKLVSSLHIVAVGILAFVRGMHLKRSMIMYGDCMHKITLFSTAYIKADYSFLGCEDI
jgi:hypothetical protein